MVRRFTAAELERLRLMADFGHDGKSIARALGRTPQAIRVKCVELGIRLRRPSVEHRRVKLPLQTWQGLRAAATARGTTVAGLARLLIEIIVRDNLFSAVVDAPPPLRRATPSKPDPKWASALRVLKRNDGAAVAFRSGSRRSRCWPGNSVP
jgi:hypothetical protein